MKKIFILLLISIFTFGIISCDLEDSIQGPQNKWCEREIEVSEVELTCYLLFTETGYTHKDLNPEKFTGNHIEPGLTVVLTPTYNGGNLDSLVYGKYVVKHFGLGTNSVTNGKSDDTEPDDTEPKKFTVGSKLWNMLWVLNSTTFTDNGVRKNPPDILKDNGKFELLEDIEGLDWKDIVIAILEGI